MHLCGALSALALTLLATPLVSASPAGYNPASATPYCDDVTLNARGQWTYTTVFNSGFSQRVTTNSFPACRKGSKPDYERAREDGWKKGQQEWKPMFPELADKVGRKGGARGRLQLSFGRDGEWVTVGEGEGEGEADESV